MYHIYGRLIQKFISVGSLRIEISGYQPLLIEGKPGRSVAIGLANVKALRRFVLDPELAVGELYMDGQLWLVDGSLEEFMAFLYDNAAIWNKHWVGKLNRVLKNFGASLRTLNHPSQSKRNVAHHYDLDKQLYDRFLDGWRQYSCAYFGHKDMDLQAAQELKLARVGAKLNMKSDIEILDIGCGWGGLAHALELFEPDVQVTGVTLSEQQFNYARTTPPFALPKHKARPIFKLMDYRDIKGAFDRVVSVGMLEAIGPQNFKGYFNQIARCLKPDGSALIHTIARNDMAKATNRWIGKYIFPGGYLPDLGQLTKAIQKSGLVITDIEIMRLHYADTLKQWRARFLAHRDEVCALYDERFVRMWEFYLLGSEYYFRSGAGMVLQIQLAHEQQAVPLTRDYIREKTNLYVKRLCQVQNSG